MNALLRFALWTCPPSFRTRYATQVLQDYADRGVTSVPRICIDLIGAGLVLRWEGLGRDVTFALRTLAKTPIFALVAIATLAVAVSINTATFSVMQSVLFAPSPYADASRLAFLCQTGDCRNNIDHAADRVYASDSTTLDGVASFEWNNATITGHGTPVSLNIGWGSWNMFDVLGVKAELGRTLRKSDNLERNLVISDRLWRSMFAADPHVVGERIILDGAPGRIVGVAPTGLAFPVPYQTWGDATLDAWEAIPETYFVRGPNNVRDWAIARIKPNVGIGTVNADLARVTQSLVRRFPGDERGLTVTAIGITDWYLRNVRVLLYSTLVASLAVLFIACANVANLVLVRLAGRRGEFAVRSAIGASFGRIVAQLLIEVGVVAMLGGLAGVGLAYGELRVLARVDPSILPRVSTVALDGRALLFTVALVFVAAAISALLPAFSLRRNLTATLRSEARGDSASAKRVRASLAVLEIALAFAVVAASGLFARSLVALASQQIGFQTHERYMAHIFISGNRYDSDASATIAFVHQAVRALAAIPSVADAAFGRAVPLGHNAPAGGPIRLPGKTYAPGQVPFAEYKPVTPDLFRAMGIALVGGRTFTESDRRSSSSVAIVNRSFARTFFGEGDALGRHVWIAGTGNARQSTTISVTIVGIVADTVEAPGATQLPDIYLPFDQRPLRYGTLVVRLRADDPNISKEMAQAISSVDPSQALIDMYSLDDALAQSTASQRSSATLLGILAAIALVLALTGIYAVVFYSVVGRTSEFGIRVAIGGRAAHILRLVINGALVLCTLGVLFGVLLATFCARPLSNLLYGVTPFDPATYAVAMLFVFTCVLLASLGPARRAARVNAVTALKAE